MMRKVCIYFNCTLSELRLQDFSSMNDKVSRLEGEVITNRKQMTILADDMEMQKRSIETLFRLSSEFRTEMDELGKQVAELQSMKKLLSVSGSAVSLFFA